MQSIIYKFKFSGIDTTTFYRHHIGKNSRSIFINIEIDTFMS